MSQIQLVLAYLFVGDRLFSSKVRALDETVELCATLAILLDRLRDRLGVVAQVRDDVVPEIGTVLNLLEVECDCEWESGSRLLS